MAVVRQFAPVAASLACHVAARSLLYIKLTHYLDGGGA